jgi:hypothetical protein
MPGAHIKVRIEETAALSKSMLQGQGTAAGGGAVSAALPRSAVGGETPTEQSQLSDAALLGKETTSTDANGKDSHAATSVTASFGGSNISASASAGTMSAKRSEIVSLRAQLVTLGAKAQGCKAFNLDWLRARVTSLANLNQIRAGSNAAKGKKGCIV